jgi:protein-disulfide isomerase
MVAPRAAARSNGRFYAILVVVAVIGAGAIVYFYNNRPGLATTAAITPAPPGSLGPGKGHRLGNADAPVTVLEFADFECPACGVFAVVTEPDVRTRLINTGQVSYQFFDYPLPVHKNTWFASEAAACAEDQGKFWEMHDLLFNGQNDWNGEATSDPSGVFKGYAKDLHLDVDKFEDCYRSQAHLRDIQANQAEGDRRRVNQTPTFVIGTRSVPGALGFDQFRALVDSAKAAGKPLAATPSGTSPTGGAPAAGAAAVGATPAPAKPSAPGSSR